MYEVKIALLENGEPEEFLLLLRSFKGKSINQDKLQLMEKFNTCINC